MFIHILIAQSDASSNFVISFDRHTPHIGSYNSDTGCTGTGVSTRFVETQQ